MEKYQTLQVIGQGTYGKVFKAVDKETGEFVALKNIGLTAEDEGIPSTAIREVALLTQLHHTNVVHLYDVVYTENSFVLVFEFLDQDLKSFLDRHGEHGLHPDTVKQLLFQMLRGIAHCHHNHVLHRDLKPQNMLINEIGELKLADFGLAREFGIPVRKFTNDVVTLWYRSPDVLLGSTEYSTNVDIWSVGCIFGELINGKPLFPGSEDSQLLTIFRTLGTPTLDSWPTMDQMPEYKSCLDLPIFPSKSFHHIVNTKDELALDLIARLLQLDPSKRISASEALRHPYFDTVNRRRP